MDVNVGLQRKLSSEELMLLNCWRRLLSIPWTTRRSNQSILKEIGPECSLEALMLKLRLWPPDAKSWLIWEDPDAGKDWGQEEKGTTEDDMAGWHHHLNGHEFGWTLGVGDGQGGLACCGSWGHKELDTTKWLNWLNWTTWNTVNQHDWGGWENCRGCELSTEWIVLRCTGYTFVHNSLTRISDKTKRGKEGEIKCEPTKYQNRE